MTTEEINALVNSFSATDGAELIETHISWVILSNEFAYKIKKPIRYSFLNYSKPMRRKYYCEIEVELNSRYSDIYLGVVPIYKNGNKVQFNKGGEVIDYAVKMQRMNTDLRMDNMLRNERVGPKDMEKLASKIAGFHQSAPVIKKPFSPREVGTTFDDIRLVKSFLYREIGLLAEEQINEAILENNHFINSNVHLFENRIKYGFVRDLHGDLHAKNIFLYEDPILFDCIEFSDDLRQIDILSEIAFLCMDLEANGRDDLSAAFLKTYLDAFPVMSSQEEEQLFGYYKCYRANVKAKVNALRAKSAQSPEEKEFFLEEASRYLELMTAYRNQFSGSYSLETTEVVYSYSHLHV